VAIIAAGEIVAEGAPDELGGRDAAALISFRLPLGVNTGDLPAEVAAALGGEATHHANGQVQLRTDEPIAFLNLLTSWALARDLDLGGLEVRRPSLEDVYLELTE